MKKLTLEEQKQAVEENTSAALKLLKAVAKPEYGVNEHIKWKGTFTDGEEWTLSFVKSNPTVEGTVVTWPNKAKAELLKNENQPKTT